MSAINAPYKSKTKATSDSPQLLTGVGFTGLAHGVWIKNHADGKIVIGDASVTSESGYTLDEGQELFLPLSKTDALFVVGAPKLNDEDEPIYTHSYSWGAL